MANGDCRGGCGQITIPPADELTLRQGWDAAMVDQLRAVWERWHLNDMRAGCEHQRDWNTAEPLELVELKWTTAYYDLSRKAASGKLSAEDYAAFSRRAHHVHRLAIEYKRPKHPALWGAAGESLLADGLLERGKVEQKAAGWVHPSEHPGGLLTKPCEVCGHRYGSAWLYEEVPVDVLEWLRALPDNTNEMPERWR